MSGESADPSARLANRSATASESLLLPCLLAAFLTTGTAWVVYLAATRSAAHDLTGHVETLLPLLRLGMVTSPFVVAFRGGLATLVVWLVAGAMNERVALRTVAAIVFLFIPILELPALVDAMAVLFAPGVSWAEAHIALGLDAVLPKGDARVQLVAASLNVALVLWVVLVARRLCRRLTRGTVVAVPATVVAALVLAVLPLVRG